jgi:hypothetical protein
MRSLRPAGQGVLARRQDELTKKILGGIMTAPLLIGIGGRLAAGKDTVGDHLVDTHGFKKLFMSDPLAQALELLNPIIGVDYDGYRVRYARLAAEVGYTAAKQHPEVRRLLQTLGTEVGRNLIGENTWVDIAARNIDEERHINRQAIVITGIRFKNELEMIRKRGGILLFVERPDMGNQSSHASEITLQPRDFDDIIVNAGSLEQLYAKVDKAYAGWARTGKLREQLELDIWPTPTYLSN